ncbi:hypothetical protein AAF712_009499 [Marasmius tenuissimus]|uniref:Uncharacterized protein n=1 Tax=Marasmius tenuissimus TaxID=585030 RepID=A0ABR2ZPS6_9AGAR|nr:hypothetical protein PM082_024267 [Marasmius tenuissimus]
MSTSSSSILTSTIVDYQLSYWSSQSSTAVDIQLQGDLTPSQQAMELSIERSISRISSDSSDTTGPLDNIPELEPLHPDEEEPRSACDIFPNQEDQDYASIPSPSQPCSGEEWAESQSDESTSTCEPSKEDMDIDEMQCSQEETKEEVERKRLAAEALVERWTAKVITIEVFNDTDMETEDEDESMDNEESESEATESQTVTAEAPSGLPFPQSSLPRTDSNASTQVPSISSDGLAATPDYYVRGLNFVPQEPPAVLGPTPAVPLSPRPSDDTPEWKLVFQEDSSNGHMDEREEEEEEGWQGTQARD